MSEPSTPPAAGETELVHAVRRGTRWVLAAQVASQVISIAVLAILFRLVSPADYGLLAAALPAVMLPRMAVTLGLQAAVLQERELSHQQLSTLFWYSAVLGLLAAAVTAVCGPVLATFYARPILEPLCTALAATSLVAALGNQHLALLERHLKMREASAVRLVAQVAGGLAGILAARRGAGVWALVAQQYGELVVLAVWAWLLEPWRPGWPGSLGQVRGLVAFSGYYSLSQLVAYAAQNLEKILIPALLSSSGDRALGLYSQASALMMKPVNLIASPLTGVIVAGLARSRDDAATHAALVARFFRLIGVALFPCALGLFAVAPDVMRVLGGRQWSEGGLILAALAPAMIVHGFTNLSAHVLSAEGRARRLLFAMTLLCLLLVQGGAAGLYFGRDYLAQYAGETSMAAALGLALATSAVLIVVWLLPYLTFVLRTVGVAPRMVLLPLLPSLRAAALMAMAVFGLRLLPPIGALAPHVRLLLLVAAGAIVYLLLARREIAWWWGETVQLRGAATP